MKYQITLAVSLSKLKTDGGIEYSSVYFNSTTRAVINNEYNLDQSFQESLYRIDNWINQGSGWIIEEIHNQYLSVSSYSPLIGNTYLELPDELKHSRKGLINIQNDDNKCFLWCHIRHLNLIDKNPQGITKKDKELIGNVEVMLKELIFLFQKTIIVKLRLKIELILVCFVMKIK